jgi:tetratricopeptide (TPR) repeat protein
MTITSISEVKDLSPERLERIGLESLYDAINVNRLIAFVGSGVSLVYGYPTWPQFMQIIVKKTNQILLDAKKSAVAEQKTAIERLRKQLELYENHTDESIITLEFCKQAFLVAEKILDSRKTYRFETELRTIFESDEGFVKTNLVNRISWATLSSTSDAGVFLENFLQSVDKFAENKKISTIASMIYSRGMLDEIRTNLGQSDQQTLQILLTEGLDKIDELLKGQWPTLPLDRRGILNIFLACLVKNSVTKNTNELAFSMHQMFRKVAVENEIILAPARPLLDPLQNLHRDLHIGRYITTNYDIQIENYFMFGLELERDRSPVALGDIPQYLDSVDETGMEWIKDLPDGTRIRSEIYDGDATSRLFEFAIGSNDNVAHILHLHGRVDMPKTMIATDSDYNRLYRNESGSRGTFDLAYDVTIAGNPILFIGSGLTEAELMRTLRQEVSNSRAREDCFAFRPAHGKAGKLARDQVNYYRQFGVFLIYYGHRRRGVSFCLRRHRIFVDRLAEKFNLKNFKLKSSAEKSAFDQYEWEARCKDFSGSVDLSKSSSDTDGLYQPDVEDLLAINSIFGEAIESLIKGKSEIKKSSGIVPVANTLGLLVGLDYDFEVCMWLASSASEELAGFVNDDKVDQLRRQAAQRLIADFLEKLTDKLEAAAVRHELRCIGEGARDSFNNWTERKVVPREVTLMVPLDVISAENIEKPFHLSRHFLYARDPNEAAVFTASEIRIGDRPSVQISGVDFRSKVLDSILHPVDPIPRVTVLLGNKGSGKGDLTREVAKSTWITESSDRSWDHSLSINFRYSQESDSAISLAVSFFATITKLDGSWGKNRSRLEAFEAVTEPFKRSINRPQFASRVRVLLGGIDRLFGVEGELLGSQFDPFFSRLFDLEDLDLVVIGSPRCERYFDRHCREVAEGKIASLDDLETGKYTYIPRFKLFMLKREADSRARAHKSYGELLEDLRSARTLNGKSFNSRSTDKVDSRIRMTTGQRRESIIIGRALDDLLIGTDNLRNDLAVGTITQEIIKTLAFIGLPTEADVLYIAPNIKKALDKYFFGSEVTVREFKTHKTLFQGALKKGIERSLLFLVDAYGFDASQRRQEGMFNSQKEPLDELAFGSRLVLHRTLSQHVRDRFGVPDSETVLSDCLQLSLYAAQPDDAPASQPKLTRDLAKMTDWFINGWRDQPLDEDFENTLAKIREDLLSNKGYANDPTVASQLNVLRKIERQAKQAGSLGPKCLRAAGGLLRGFFSSANMLGLDIADSDGNPIPQGVITKHKERIIRLVSTAQEITNLLSYPKKATVKELLLSSLVRDYSSVRPEVKYNFPVFSKQHSDLLDKAIHNLKILSSSSLYLEEVQFKPEPSEQQPFYHEEVAWLLNERAMLALAQGDLYVASTSFEYAAQAVERIEHCEYQSFTCRVELNRALLRIERGKISEARHSLSSLLMALRERRVNGARSPRNLSREFRRLCAISEGFIALCDQLNGLASSAKKHYEAALVGLNDLREQRAVAIFNLHLGTLYQGSLFDAKAAAICYETALSAAESGRHTDIVYRVRVAKASLMVQMYSMGEGRLETDMVADRLADLAAAIRYGERLDMHRVTVEALCVRAQLRLDLGDVRASESDIARALALATRNGMTLRRILLRVLQGKAFEKKGDLKNCKFMYERALSEAESVGYVNAAKVASQRLSTLRTG